MTLLTVFSAPKPFTDPHIAMIQRNAIRSWTLLPDVDVILVGDEEGTAQVASELSTRHLPGVKCNDSGTPLVSSIFDLARQNSDSPLLCYVNADILLLPDLVEAARIALKNAQNFLLVGQRWDVDVTDTLDFSGDWAARLRSFAISQGSLHVPAGSDYFVFPRACFIDMPSFAIGRAGWDNWMIYKSRKERWATVDATESVMVLHQSHDYSHLPGGQPHYKLPESKTNIRLAGGREMTRFTLLDTDKRLSNGRLASRIWTRDAIRRYVETFPLLRLNNAAMTERLAFYFRRANEKWGGK
jgi:hypothetical protein